MEEKFENFAQRQKEFYQGAGMDTQVEAQRGKENAANEAEAIEKRIEEYKAKIESLSQEIADKKSNLIARVLEFKKIRELEKKLGIHDGILKSYDKELAQKQELISAYDYLINQEEEMMVLMDEAYQDNAEWDENKRLEILAEREARDVTKLASKHAVFFVHDIVDADWKPSENNKAIKTDELDFNDQLDILHGLDPTISVSTLHEGSKQRTFGKGSWGVFLSGGKVLGGEPGDAGSVSYGLKDRRFHSADSYRTDAIDNAILRKSWSQDSEYDPRMDTGYNELIVENPEIAGVYIKWDSKMPNLDEKMRCI